MGVLQDERSAIVQTLTPIIPTTNHLPERVVPPAAFIHPGGPYVASGQTFGTHEVRFEVWLVMRAGTNETVTAELDDVIEQAAQTLMADGWTVETVDEPFLYSVQNANYLTAIMHVTTGVRLND